MRSRSTPFLAPALAVALAVVAPSARAQGGVTVTGPANDVNCFPFGCTVPGTASTRYQQVYTAAAFPGLFSFNTVAFFPSPNERRALNTGSFSLYFSTTSAAVNGLTTANYDANLGTNTVLFGTFTIGGAAPSVLTFVGAPYTYNPAAGNLLLDLRVNGAFTGPAQLTLFQSHSGAGNTYSRATDFAADPPNAAAGFGLDTQFTTTVSVAPEPTTLALSLGGLAVLGVAVCRRRA